MIFLDLDELLHGAERTLGAPPQIRDIGLLQSTLARPQASVLGEDAYPSIHAKSTAQLRSLARNHGLVDGNKRLALVAALAFYGLNGLRLALTNDEAYDVVMAVASGELDDVIAITTLLERAARPRG